MKSTILLTAALAAASAGLARAGITLNPLTTFGGGDGWRAPGEILSGDAAGTNNGTAYTYLGTGNNERGLCYNPALDRVFLLSRNGGIHIRTLDASTGQDYGSVPTTGVVSPPAVSGVTFFAANYIACTPDGVLYTASLTTNATTGAFRVYRWDDTGSNPVLHFDSTISGFASAPRLGDSFDVFASGSSHTLVAGAANAVGYLLIPAENTSTAITGFTPSNPAASDFRPGLTFGPDGAGQVWGKATNGSFRRTTYAGNTGTYTGTGTLAGGSTEAAMDVILLGGVHLMATLEMNNGGGSTGRPNVRIYDVTNSGAPVIAATGTTVSGTLNGNANAAGTIKWGKVTGDSATLYAMSTNQGIQAFTVTVTPDPVAPAILSSPGSRTVYERGQTTFTASASGSPAPSYQWYKDADPINGATSASYTINPVTAASGGSYFCRATNSAGSADTTAAILTVAPSVNTAALTPCWSLAPGSRPWITSSGDTERGIDYNPANNHVYIISRNPSPQVYVVDGTTGTTINQLDVTGVSGGNFTLMYPGVNGDGALYACNLSNTADGSSFKIYKWTDDAATTVPVAAYDGNPIGSRIGDSFDVRGSGASTKCVAGARNTNQFVLFSETSPGVLTPVSITVAGAPNGSFGLGIAFGEGNTVWGKGDGGSLYYCSYDAGSGSGSVIASYTTGIPAGTNPLGVDVVNRCIAMIDTGNSDNVRLFSYSADAVPVLTLLDQEFFPTDNANGNRVGSVYAGAGKVYALDTNNGVLCLSTLKPALPVLGAISPGPAGNFSVDMTGTPGFTYVIESSPDLVTWTPFASVPFTAATQTVQLPTATSRQFYRARLGP